MCILIVIVLKMPFDMSEHCGVTDAWWRYCYDVDSGSSLHVHCVMMTSPLSETSVSQWDTVSDSDTVFEDVYEMFEVIGKWVRFADESSHNFKCCKL